MSESKFTNTLYTNDNLFIFNGLNSNSVDLIYIDPPFNSNWRMKKGRSHNGRFGAMRS